MYSISNYEYECTRKCKSIEHGSRITALLTKRSISDEKLLLFIAKSCRNVDVVDCEVGTRTAIVSHQHHLPALQISREELRCIWLHL